MGVVQDLVLISAAVRLSMPPPQRGSLSPNIEICTNAPVDSVRAFPYITLSITFSHGLILKERSKKVKS